MLIYLVCCHGNWAYRHCHAQLDQQDAHLRQHNYSLAVFEQGIDLLVVTSFIMGAVVAAILNVMT